MREPTKRQLEAFRSRFSGNKERMRVYLQELCTKKKVKELADMFGVTRNRIQLDRNWFTEYQRSIKESVKKYLRVL